MKPRLLVSYQRYLDELNTWAHRYCHDTGRRIPCFEKEAINWGRKSLLTSCLETGRHLARLRRRRHSYTPMSNTAGNDNHGKINSWVAFSFLCGYGLMSCLKVAWLPACFSIFGLIGNYLFFSWYNRDGIEPMFNRWWISSSHFVNLTSSHSNSTSWWKLPCFSLN